MRADPKSDSVHEIGATYDLPLVIPLGSAKRTT